MKHTHNVHRALTRRQLIAAGGITSAVALVGCGAAPSQPDAQRSPTNSDLSDVEKTVMFSNWPLYIDPDEGDGSTLTDFVAQTGINVVYTDDINDSNEFFAKVRTNLEQGRSIDRDIVVVNEEYVETWIAEGYAAPLNKALIPNAKNLLPKLQNVPYDQGRMYSLPWQSGFTGIGWNTDYLQRETGLTSISSLDDFFAPELKGRITILAEMTDTMGVLLNWQGFSMSDFTPAQFDDTLAVLRKKVDEGFIRQVTGNDYIAALETGDAIASIGWSGDVLALGEGFGFSLPESGGMIWSDAMVIPSVATHKKNAEILMNYYYDPIVAARVAAWVNYVCPVQGAQEAMADIDPDLVDDPWIFPTSELLAQSQEFMYLGPEVRDQYTRAFLDTVGY